MQCAVNAVSMPAGAVAGAGAGALCRASVAGRASRVFGGVSSTIACGLCLARSRPSAFPMNGQENGAAVRVENRENKQNRPREEETPPSAWPRLCGPVFASVDKQRNIESAPASARPGDVGTVKHAHSR